MNAEFFISVHNDDYPSLHYSNKFFKTFPENYYKLQKNFVNLYNAIN